MPRGMELPLANRNAGAAQRASGALQRAEELSDDVVAGIEGAL